MRGEVTVIRKSFIAIGVLVIITNLSGVIGEGAVTHPNPTVIATFADKYIDYKVKEDESGLTYLKVDIEVDIRKEGVYQIIGFLNGGTVKSGDGYIYATDSKHHLRLNPGKHKITFSFDGRTIYEGKYKTYSLDLMLNIDEKDPSYNRETFCVDEKKRLTLVSI